LADAGQFFFIVYAVFVLLSRPVTGRLLDSKGENYVMYPAIFILAVGLFVVSRAQAGFALLAGGAFVGVGYSTIASSIQPIAIKVCPKNRIELATSTSFIFQDLGMGLGPFILGGFVPSVGYRGLYIMMSGVVLVCILLYYFLHGRKKIADDTYES
jgi:MFS family permease